MSTLVRNKKEGLSVIVPYLNEEDGIGEFCSVVDKYAGDLDFFLELVFVDDGSSDNTTQIIRGTVFQNIKSVKVVTLAKNFGSHAAIRAGVFHSSCDICTWMGSDLQEPIDFLKICYKEIREGYDAVYVEKNTIKVSKKTRFFSRVYSSMMRKYAVSNYASGGISNIMFNEKIINLLNENIESNSSIMLQIMDAGFNYRTISMDYNERYAGESKWTLSKKIKLFIDSFVSFSFMPIRLVSIIGVIIFFIGVVIGIFTIANKLMNPNVPVGYSTLASIMALGFGVTNISLGIIAEYLWRTYAAARRRPTFIVSDIEEIK